MIVTHTPDACSAMVLLMSTVWNLMQEKRFYAFFSKAFMKRYIIFISAENLSWGKHVNRADPRFAPSQWEAALLCNDVSHWLGTGLESALCQASTWVTRCHITYVMNMIFKWNNALFMFVWIQYVQNSKVFQLTSIWEPSYLYFSMVVCYGMSAPSSLMLYVLLGTKLCIVFSNYRTIFIVSCYLMLLMIFLSEISYWSIASNFIMWRE